MVALHRIVLMVARLTALIGGLVLLALILITCLSILGRAANTALHSMVASGFLPGMAQGLLDAGIGAVRGDYELVEAGMAFAIFAFLPFCQVTMGHASVDVFTNHLPRRANRFLDVLIALAFAVALVVIAVQLGSGMERKMSSGQTSLLLEFPVWWAYAASLFGAVLAAAVSVYMVLLRLYEFVTGRLVAPNAVGADH